MAKKPSPSDGGEPTDTQPQPQPPVGQAQPQAGAQPQADEAQQSARPQLSILGQFVRDLSFESPGAPATLQSPGDNPKLQLNVNVQASKRGDDVYEVSLNFDARAASDAGVIYNIELVYGGLFRLSNIPDNALQPILFVDCPTLLFPYLRRIVSQLSQDGGFPPLMLDPIDFASLYRRNQQQGAQQQGVGAAPGAGAPSSGPGGAG